MTLIVSFDPGETTGIAVVQWSSISKVATVRYAFTRGTVNLKAWLLQLQTGEAAKLLRYEGAGMVCEQFRLYPEMREIKRWSSLPEVLAQGAIEYVAYAVGIKLRYQTPSAMKAMFPRSGKRRQEMRRAGVVGHAQDALCHALLYIVRGEGLAVPPKLDYSQFERR